MLNIRVAGPRGWQRCNGVPTAYHDSWSRRDYRRPSRFNFRQQEQEPL